MVPLSTALSSKSLFLTHESDNSAGLGWTSGQGEKPGVLYRHAWWPNIEGSGPACGTLFPWWSEYREQRDKETKATEQSHSYDQTQDLWSGEVGSIQVARHFHLYLFFAIRCINVLGSAMQSSTAFMEGEEELNIILKFLAQAVVALS